MPTDWKFYLLWCGYKIKHYRMIFEWNFINFLHIVNVIKYNVSAIFSWKGCISDELPVFSIFVSYHFIFLCKPTNPQHFCNLLILMHFYLSLHTSHRYTAVCFSRIHSKSCFDAHPICFMFSLAIRNIFSVCCEISSNIIIVSF